MKKIHVVDLFFKKSVGSKNYLAYLLSDVENVINLILPN